MNSIHQFIKENNTLIELIADGIHWNKEAGEYEIWLNGESVAWAETYSAAEHSYFEMLRVEREHRQRNLYNNIPFNGEPIPYESDVDDYGLGARI